MKAFTVMGLVLFVASGAARAADFNSGDWVWNADDPSVMYAATMNDAGQMLAQFCDASDGSCVYAVGFQTQCDVGDTYPVMINSDIGAAYVEFHCAKQLKDMGNLMVATDFDQLDGFVRKASRIGFALPMQGDRFKAVRFSLKGAVPALDAMRKVASMSKGTQDDARKVRDSNVF